MPLPVEPRWQRLRHAIKQEATMSHASIRFSQQRRVRRAAILAAILIAAIITALVLFASGAPSRAAAASVHPVSSHGVAKAAAVTQVRSDSKVIAAALPVRALAAAQAKQEAAANAAAQAAAAAAAAAQAAAARAAAVAAASRKLNVWTAGFQTQINACRGGVDVTAHYGTPTVAEHWSCGGSSFPTAAGTIVTLTGLDAGTYRVVGVVAILNAYTANVSQIPRGYSLLFQTCRNGDSHHTEFVGLQKIG
jgi:hypothetical protein